PELYVALAGSHQVALVQDDFIEPIAGDGREAQIDGSGLEAALAQPSGLSLQGDVLYVADSESSGVRAIDLRSRKIYSLAGGPGLFDFGDKVGPIEPGMLQHPLAVAATQSAGLLVADTYNDKIKRFSPDGLRLEPFYEGGLEQPAGLCVLPEGDVLIADTNHHRILKIGARVEELKISGAPEPQRGVVAAPQAASRKPQVGCSSTAGARCASRCRWRCRNERAHPLRRAGNAAQLRRSGHVAGRFPRALGKEALQPRSSRAAAPRGAGRRTASRAAARGVRSAGE